MTRDGKFLNGRCGYNDVDDVGRTSWHTRPRGRLAATPISELALIIAVATTQLWRWHNGAAPADDGSDGPTHSGVASLEKKHQASSSISSTAADNDRRDVDSVSDDVVNHVFIITSQLRPATSRVTALINKKQSLHELRICRLHGGS